MIHDIIFGMASAVDPLLDPFRPRFHFTPRFGWMNDPAGLVHHDGEWHLFYQHNPAQAAWGDIHWGHAVSRDLIRWTHLPPALAPHPRLGQVFTGSVVVDRDHSSGPCGGTSRLAALFTHAMGADDEQAQSLALSTDRGRSWSLHPDNPVIPNPGISDFRDPRVLWHDATRRWVMVLAAHDRARLYHSTDLVRWDHAGDVGPISGLPPGVWECPDLFPLRVEGTGQRLWVFKLDLSRGQGHLGASRYLVGTFDGARFSAQGSAAGRPLDGGLDFFAAQSFSNAPAGERIWIGWLNNWQYAPVTPTGTWRGAMSIPRRLSLVRSGSDVLLAQQPVDQLARLRRPLPLCLSDGVELADGATHRPLPGGVQTDSLELELELEPRGATVQLRLLQTGRQYTTVGYDSLAGELFLDRTRAGDASFHRGFAVRRVMRHPLPPDGRLRLRLFVDRSTVEVFADDGRSVISALVFPQGVGGGVQLVSSGGRATVRRLAAWSLDS